MAWSPLPRCYRDLYADLWRVACWLCRQRVLVGCFGAGLLIGAGLTHLALLALAH